MLIVVFLKELYALLVFFFEKLTTFFTLSCRSVPVCLPEEVDPGPQQADHPARGHPSHRATRPRPQGRTVDTAAVSQVPIEGLPG